MRSNAADSVFYCLALQPNLIVPPLTPSDNSHSRLRRFFPSRRQGLWSISVLGLFGFTAYALVATAPQPEAVLTDLPSLTVEAYTVARKDIAPHATFTGRLQPRRSAALRFEVSGQLLHRAAEPGITVSAGDTLLILDDRDFKDQVRTAEAELRLEESGIERDRVQLEQATRHRELQREEVTRHTRLGERSLLSQSSLNAAEQKLTELESRVAELTHSVETGGQRLALKQAKFDQARRDLARTRLTAPFDGRVNTVLAEVGDRITGDQTVVSVVDVTELDFYVEVDGATALALELNQEVTVKTGEEEHPGILVALQTDPDPRTFTHAVRIRIPGDRAAPGQLAVAQLPLPVIRNALVVPVEALRVDAAGQAVFRIEGQSLQRIAVMPGPRVGSWQVIESELEEGDQIVARDAAAMDARRPIRVRE